MMNELSVWQEWQMPRASEGPQGVEKMLPGPWISKDVVHEALHAKV